VLPTSESSAKARAVLAKAAAETKAQRLPVTVPPTTELEYCQGHPVTKYITHSVMTIYFIITGRCHWHRT
jgi:hypothetical protein